MKHTFSCLKSADTERRASLPPSLWFPPRFPFYSPCHSHLFLVPAFPSPLAFLSPPFISSHRYRSLSFSIIALAFSSFTSLSKEPDVFLVWFIQMQRLGLRECCRRNALCFSSNGWVYFLSSFLMQMSFSSLVWIMLFLWLKQLHHQCGHDNISTFTGLLLKKVKNSSNRGNGEIEKIAFASEDVSR